MYIMINSNNSVLIIFYFECFLLNFPIILDNFFSCRENMQNQILPLGLFRIFPIIYFASDHLFTYQLWGNLISVMQNGLRALL